MKTILLVENDPQIMQMSAEMLAMQGYVVLKAYTVESCKKELYWHPVDLVVLHFVFPDEKIAAVCHEIKENYHIPVLLVCDESKKEDVINKMMIQEKDILTKPYDLTVLADCVQDKLLNWEESNRYIHYGSLKIDLNWKCGYINNTELQLTEREFEVLLILVKNAENIVPTSRLTGEIWYGDPEGSIQTVWTMMSRLRKKICSEKSGLEITSVRGMGYKLEKI